MIEYLDYDEERNVCGLCGRDIENPCEKCGARLSPPARLPCGCPLDSGCSGHHADGST